MAMLESYLFSFKTLTSDEMLIHMYVGNVFGEKISSGYPGCQRLGAKASHEAARKSQMT